MNELVARVLTPRRLRLYAYACLIGVTIGYAVFLVTSSGLHAIRGGRVGGDFPAFYSAGTIVRSGNVAGLYRPDVQRAAQAGMLPNAPGGWLPYVYPPYVAAAYAPLTWLPFKIAYIVHTVLMVFCGVVALAFLRPALPGLSRHFGTALAAVLTFYPMFRANVGGQNTALSLLCAAGAAAALARRRDVAAGLWLGAWMFKPQLAGPVAILVAIAYPRTLIGSVIGGGAWYLLGAAMAGFDWPLWWYRDALVPFSVPDLVVNRGNGVSFRQLASDVGVPSLGWVLVIATAMLVLWHTVRTRGSAQQVALTGLATATAVLVAPHALFYDAGLAVLALAAAGNTLGGAAVPALIGTWVLGALQPLRPYLPLSPLTVVLIAAVLLAARVTRAGRSNAGTNRLHDNAAAKQTPQ